MDENLMPENYNSQNIVSIWWDYVNWEKRRRGEDNFLVNQFHKHNVKKVFDVALGDGCDSIYLLKQGFDVTSNEIDKIFLDKALENAKVENVELKLTSLDWRKLNTELAECTFDAVTCLGNSLTILLTKQDQIEALGQFKRLLRNNGILIIDERNYQYILDNREKISQGNFHYSGKYVYCGDKVIGKPTEISDTKVKWEIIDEATKKRVFIWVYPFKRGELKNLLAKTGFTSIEQFSDYKVGENHNADFYQYICVK